MRQVLLDRPFVAGVVLDQPSYKLGPQNSEYAKDLIAPEGIATQRHGWAYDGTTRDFASGNLVGVDRHRYLLAGATRTVTSDDGTRIMIHNPTSAGTILNTLNFTGTGSAEYLPRAFYRDQLILCATDGVHDTLRYSGAAGGTDIAEPPLPTQLNAATAQLEVLGGVVEFGANQLPGTYVTLGYNAPRTSHLVLERTSDTKVTLQDIYASATAGQVHYPGMLGVTYPAIEVYSAGTVTVSSGTVTGTGVKWLTGDWGAVRSDGYDSILLSPPGANAEHFPVEVRTDETHLESAQASDQATGITYSITRSAAYRDAAAHKGSLFGAGMAAWPNRIFVGPNGWNLSCPPGETIPWDPSLPNTSPNRDNFLLDFIDIPASFDGDDVIAILASPDPLLALKGKDAYGVYGEFPNFARALLPGGAGAGCIDIRSAQELSYGQFWAGPDDIHAFTGNEVVGLTTGAINRLWRSMTRQFDTSTGDYCVIGETNGHLFVSIRYGSIANGAGGLQRTMIYDLLNKAWISIDFSNHDARYMASTNIPGERRRLLWIGNDLPGRVMDSAPCIDRTGTAKDGDGSSPLLEAWTSTDLDGTGEVTSETKVMDAAITTNITDAGAAGSTSMDVSLVSGAGLTSPADSTKALGTIDSDAVDRVDRTRFHPINRKGRLHQLRLEVTTLGTNTSLTKVEVPEIAITVEDMRSRT